MTDPKVFVDGVDVTNKVLIDDVAGTITTTTGTFEFPLLKTMTGAPASGIVHTWPTTTAMGSGFYDPSGVFGGTSTSGTVLWPSATTTFVTGTVWPVHWRDLTAEDEKLIEEFLIDSFARGFAKEQAA